MMYMLISLLLALPACQFDERENEKYTLMYFYNPGCPSCNDIADYIESLKKDHGLVMYEFNSRTPTGYQFCVEYRVYSVPTMIVIIDRGDGAESELRRFQGSAEILEAERELTELGQLTPAGQPELPR